MSRVAWFTLGVVLGVAISVAILAVVHAAMGLSELRRREREEARRGPRRLDG